MSPFARAVYPSYIRAQTGVDVDRDWLEQRLLRYVVEKGPAWVNLAMTGRTQFQSAMKEFIGVVIEELKVRASEAPR